MSDGSITVEHRISHGESKWGFDNRATRDAELKRMTAEHARTGAFTPPRTGRLILGRGYGGKPNPENGSKLPAKRRVARADVLDFGNGRGRWSRARRDRWKRRRAPNPQVTSEKSITTTSSLPPEADALSRTLPEMDIVKQALWRARLRVEKGEGPGHPFRGNQYVGGKGGGVGVAGGGASPPETMFMVAPANPHDDENPWPYDTPVPKTVPKSTAAVMAQREQYKDAPDLPTYGHKPVGAVGVEDVAPGPGKWEADTRWISTIHNPATGQRIQYDSDKIRDFYLNSTKTKTKAPYESPVPKVYPGFKTTQKGEAKGHPFRGNQFVTGRSNAGGATRGKDRAAQVHALNEARRKKRPEKPEEAKKPEDEKKPDKKKGKPEDPGAKGRANARSHGGNAYGPGGKPDSKPDAAPENGKKRGK